MTTRTMTVVRNGRLLDIKGHRAPPADILISGDTIVEIGPTGLSAPADAVVVDATDRLIHPGLINAHTHGHGNLSKGMGDRLTLELLLTAAPWLSGNRSTEDKYLTTYIGALEMLMKGCTACYDLTVEFPQPTQEGLTACAKAYSDAGMRAVLAPMVANLSFYEAIPGLMDVLPAPLQKEVERLRLAPYEASITAMGQVLKDWRFDRDLVRPAVAPTIPHHCSDEFMRACARLAREHGVGLHSHVQESKVQVIVGLKKYGKTPTAHLEDLGLLGPDFVAAHGVWLDGDDIARLADHGASVAHNPGSNMLLGNGIAAVKLMLEKKLNVGIGILEAATIGSARALGFGDKLGRIANGYKADLVFVDLNHINWIPCNDPTNQLVHTEDGTGVHSVMVGGRMVVENCKPVGVDLQALARKAEAARQRLGEVNAPNKVLFAKLEGLVNAFCPGLAKTPYHVDHFAGGSAH